MDSSTFINALLLCLLNASFMVAGIFLNSVVIISLWKSSQLRKKLCYFMILILSCFDLAVVTFIHPVLILSTISWSMKTLHKEITIIWVCAFIPIAVFSMISLLTLNIERFLALTYPFFHQTAVTKKRLVLFQAFWMIIILIFSLLQVYFHDQTISYISITVLVLVLLLLFIYLNYKIFIIAKSKRKDDRVTPASTATASGHQEREKRKINLKNISTCCLAVACFFICSSPQIICSFMRFTETLAYDRHAWLFSLWSTTFVAMNSTFNCLIFFWRNSILRREGMKIAKCFRNGNS